MADETKSIPKNWTFKFFLLVLFATFVPTITVALLTLRTSSLALLKEAETKLTVANDSTKEQLIRWTKSNRDDLVFASQSSIELISKLEQFFQAPKNSEQRTLLRDALFENEITRFLEHHDNFFELFILDPQTGEVVISSNPEEEGKLKTDRPYFQSGKVAPFTQNVYFSLSLQRQATTVSTPIVNKEGTLIAVLAGRVSLETLNDVLRQPSGLGDSAQSYAVNSFKFIVAGLQGVGEENLQSYYFKPINTFAVLEALQGKSGVNSYPTYNNVTVVGSYLPIEGLDLVVITEMNEAEILEPIQTLKTIVVGVTVLTILITALVAIVLTRILLSSTEAYRKALEREKDAVVAERNKLEVIISGITDAVIAVDLERHIIIFNKAAEVITGFSAEEVFGKPINQVIKAFDKGEELAPSNFCPTGSGDFEGVVFNRENLKLIGKGHKEVFVNLIAATIKEGAVARLGCILTLHDVTGERDLEQMKLDFVSMAAHELRTPLTAIRGYTSLLLAEASEQLDPEHKEDLRRLSISAINLANLIDNLLHVSRIERGTFKVKIVPNDFVSLIQESIANFEEQTKSKNQTLTFTQPKQTLPLVMADRFRIVQVLSNLFSNAVSYTGEGGTITVSVMKVTSSKGRKGNFLAVLIKDNGQGIPKEALPKLFTKFFRVSGALEKGSKGTGLGLFISKSIVDMHNGDIWVESELGKGSTFTFTLNVATDKDIAAYEQVKKTSALPDVTAGAIILNKERLRQKSSKT